MDDMNKKRTGVSQTVGAGNLAGRGPMYAAPVGSGIQYSTKPANSMFPSTPSNMNPHAAGNDGLNILTKSFSGMNLGAAGYNPHRSSTAISGQNPIGGGVPLNNNGPYVFNGQLLWHHPGINASLQNGMHSSAGFYNHVQTPHHLANGSPYQQLPNPYLGHSPNWTNSRNTSSEMPSLLTPRRDSSSSNENEVPGTPFTQYTGYGAPIGVLDYSPSSLAAWSTPSPSQQGFAMGKPAPPVQIPLHLQLLCQQEPQIPRAVPSHTPKKPLDRALENPNGMTNVYIRGLHLDTSDEMLFALAARFGDIVSSKSILDHNTGECKGYGFVKYHNFKDAENCIRGFHFCGYEASFARESFYNQLKKLSDELNTNLYVSNLPKDMNEAELAAIFDPFKVCSSRILRNNDGSGRGVGFARFDSRGTCAEVIKEFNNYAVAKVDGEEHFIQIRFADTPEQKALKQQTTAARQYRSAEYESQTHGPNAIYNSTRASSLTPTMMAHQDVPPYVMNMSPYAWPRPELEMELTEKTSYPAVQQHAASSPIESRFGARQRLDSVNSQFSPSKSAIGISLSRGGQIDVGSRSVSANGKFASGAIGNDAEPLVKLDPEPKAE